MNKAFSTSPVLSLFFITVLGLSGCTGKLTPGKPVDGSSQKPPQGSDGGAGGNVPPAEGDGNGGGGTGGGGGITVPPVVTMINLKGGEVIPGAQTYKIFFSVKDESIGFNEVKIEYQRDGDYADTTHCANENQTCAFTGTKTIRYGAGSKWVTRTLTDGTPCTNAVFTDPLVGVGKTCQIVPDGATPVWRTIADRVATVSEVETSVDWPVCPQEDDSRCLPNTDGGGYRIRITAKGKDNLEATEVSPGTFSIDSAPPTITNTGLALKGGSPTNGFIQFVLTGAQDSLSNVADVCVKSSDSTAPLSSDACWVSVEAYGVAKSLTPAPITITQYLGFFNGTYNFYIWVRDEAGNMTTMTLNNNSAGGVSKDMISHNYSYGNSPMWKDASGDFNFATDSSAAVGINTYTGVPGDNATTMADPGSFAINSKGQMIVLDKTNGLILVDLVARTRTSLVAIGVNTIEGTTGPAGTGRLKNPLHIGVDEDDWVWIQDEEHLAYIDSTGALKIAAGGGSDVNDNIADPLDLDINYHVNMKWYGTFAVLPNKQIIFNSEDPHAPLNPTAGSRFRLRVYHGKENGRIETIAFSGSYGGSSVNDLVPYGGMAFTYDTSRKYIRDIVGRFCVESGGTCTDQLMLQFGPKGTAPVLLNSHSNWSNLTLRGSLDSIYAFNSQRGLVSKLDLTYKTWSKVLGGTTRGTGYCNDNISATSCNVRLTDVFITKQNRIFFMDASRLRSIEIDGRVQTLYNGQFDIMNATNCATLRAAGHTATGYYSIDPDGIGGANPFTAYCDMTTDGGGWMLVARSVASGTGTIGWKVVAGDVTNEKIPFSMGETQIAAVGFTQMLFGNYVSAKSWGGYVYRWQNIPTNFLSANATTVYTNTPGTTPQAIVGGNTTFNMARYSGFANSAKFFFRDTSADASYGLFQDGWRTNSNNAAGGFINGNQGMIFIKP